MFDTNLDPDLFPMRPLPWCQRQESVARTEGYNYNVIFFEWPDWEQTIDC